MSRNDMMRVFGMLVCCGLVAGCATTDSMEEGAEGKEAEVTTDGVDVVAIHPASPARLNYDERLTVDVRYGLVSAEQGLVLVRPYTNGRQSKSYQAHPSVKVTRGTEEVSGYFSFETDSRVDEVRVTLVDPVAKALLASFSYPVDAVWSSQAADDADASP